MYIKPSWDYGKLSGFGIYYMDADYCGSRTAMAWEGFLKETYCHPTSSNDGACICYTTIYQFYIDPEG